MSLPADRLREIEALPRLGWVSEFSPIEELEVLAVELGLGALRVKRDDHIAELAGGNKVRKLDYLLAQDTYRRASHWHATGGLGSSQLVSSALAARQCGKTLTAHVFDQPISSGVMENFARTKAGASKLVRYRSRTAMAMRRPQLFLRQSYRGEAIIPAGGTSAVGSLGFVRAGLELAKQIDSGQLPSPDRIYIAIGSGGSAVGLALGLALAGVQCPVHAIAIVEPWMVARPRIECLFYEILIWLRRHGVDAPWSLRPKLVVDTSCVGEGYAHPTLASKEACTRLRSHGLRLEPVYTGKAMAALLRDALELPGREFLFWHTCMREQ